jgi:type IV pilus assembly protein PilV
MFMNSRGHPTLFVCRECGFSMLEVLITIVIIAFGLLGIAGLQARLQLAEIESFQRGQAVVLLDDMVARLNANRRNATSYDGAAVGTGSTLDCSAPSPGTTQDLCDWNNALLGASETKAGGTCTSADSSGCIGAMIGARGCITNTLTTNPREFVVAVVWQGITPTATPTSTTCGQGSYGDEGTRRAAVAKVKIGCLLNDKDGVCCRTIDTATNTCLTTP